MQVGPSYYDHHSSFRSNKTGVLVADLEKIEVIQDVVLVRPQVFPDPRGRFMETYRRSWFPLGRINSENDNLLLSASDLSKRTLARSSSRSAPEELFISPCDTLITPTKSTSSPIVTR